MSEDSNEENNWRNDYPEEEDDDADDMDNQAREDIMDSRDFSSDEDDVYGDDAEYRFYAGRNFD